MAEDNNLQAAYAKAWAEIKQPELDGSNPHFRSKYATLASTQACIRKACADNGIAYVQRVSLTEGGAVLVSEVVGACGSLHLSDYPVQFVPNPQSNGSMLTYAKRQLCCIDWGVCGDEDDDGNAAAQSPQGKQQAARKTPQKQAAKPAPKAQSALMQARNGLWQAMHEYCRATTGLDGKGLTDCTKREWEAQGIPLDGAESRLVELGYTTEWFNELAKSYRGKTPQQAA